MKKLESYDREKFVETARALEAERMDKQEKWNETNRDWIKAHGPIPFQEPRLIFAER